MPAASIIQVQDIKTRFGSQVVHDGVSFQIKQPEIVALIGGSGCGKSVLLKEIIGLQRPTAGKIFVLEKEIWKLAEHQLIQIRNRIGVLFQNGALFSALSVAENIAVPLHEQTDLPAEIIEQIVLLRLALCGLPTSSAAKMPSELSGGMRKRVALARALALEPQILFLDEPTSGLDPINARAFDKLIRTLCDSLALTIILVTHDLDTIEGIVDRVIVLGEGHVLADGPVREVSRNQHEWIQTYFASRWNQKPSTP